MLSVESDQLHMRPGIMHSASTTRRLITLAAVFIAIAAGSISLLTASSWRISNSQWEKAGSPWKIDLVDPKSSAGKILLDAAQKSETSALIVVKNGRLVFEYYRGLSFKPGRRWWAFFQGPTRRYGTASLAKPLVGSMALLVAVSDGLIDLEDPAAQYIEGWSGDATRSAITLGQLASHSSGLPHGRKRGRNRPDWEIAFWSNRTDLFDRVLEDARPVFEPGTGYRYSGPAWAVLGYAVTKAIANTPTDNIRSLLLQRIMAPIGIPDEDWRIGYGKVFDADGMELYAMWGGAMFTARAAARIGQLMLNRGAWDGTELVSSNAVDEIVSYAGIRVPVGRTYPIPGVGWWSNINGALRFLPCDAYIGAGAGHQLMIIVPSENLVIARFGGKLGRSRWDGDFWEALDRRLLMPMAKSGLLSKNRSSGKCVN